VVPVNGLISIKGDGAKSLIFQSGVLEPGSWIETETGSIENNNYTFSITASRKDNGLKLTRSFSVEMARRAGLWITPEQIKGQDGWKWQKSSWYKYPDRMIRYRALGFISRDLFTDVIAGMYTAEEAADLPPDTTQVIDTGGGAQIILPDKGFSQQRSTTLTSKATEKINKNNPPPPAGKKSDVHTGPNNPHNVPIPGGMASGGLATSDKDNRSEEAKMVFNEEDLKAKSIDELLAICEAFPIMEEAVKLIPGKNTNKKLREIIMSYQTGILDEMMKHYKSDSGGQPAGPGEDHQPAGEEHIEEELAMEPMGGQPGEVTDVEYEEPQANPDLDDQAGKFEETGEQPDLPKGNDVGIEVPPLPEEGGKRDFSEAARLYGAMNELKPPLSDKRFLELSASSPIVLQKYASKEDLCMRAAVDEINYLLTINSEW
jgi:hypothetical protein